MVKITIVDDNKTALVIHPYLQELGGAEQVFIYILQALTEQNIKVSVLGGLSKPYSFEAFSRVKEIPYGKTSFRFKIFQVYQKFFRHELLKPRLKRKAGSIDYEILTQDLMFFLGVGAKKVAYVHYPENLWRVEGGGISGRFWKFFYLPVSRRLRHYAKESDLLLCNSEYTKMAIFKKWNLDATVIYPPVDVKSFKPSVKENFVVTVGRFVRVKNYEIVVEAAKRLPNVKFVIIGRKLQADPYYDKILKSKPENLVLMPNLPFEDMNTLVSKAKVYLHTMVGEHFGISVVEAMAAGCVPVVHNSGGTRETVLDIGYVYNDIDECVACIQKAIDGKLAPAVIVKHAQKFNPENFKAAFKAALK